MKKHFLLLPALLATLFLTAFAGPSTSNNPLAEQNFNKQFAGAENVSWTKVEEGYLKVSFTWGGHRTEAYFNSQAEFVGAIRGLFYQQLPLSVVRSVDKAFNNPVVLEVREITNAQGTSYSLLMERKKGRYKVLLNSDGSVQQQEKVK